MVVKARGEVEALRGLAALGVLFSHCWAVGRGSAATFGTPFGRLGLVPGEGLSLFFALSGYLLTRLLLAPRPDHPRYYRHRVARILPTWWFVLAVLLLLDQEHVPHHLLWRFPLLLQGFWSDTVLAIDAPAWTLAVEAQYYLVLPLLVVLLRRGRALALGTVAVLAAGSLLVHVETVVRAHPSETWRYSLPANLVYFVPGIALAVLERRTGLVAALRRLPRPRVLLLVASLPFWLSYVVLPRSGPTSALGAGLTVAAVALPLGEGGTVRLLRGRALVTAGALSFGIYLWHTPVLITLLDHGVTSWWGLLVLDGTVSAVLAAISLVLVERPFLALRDQPVSRWRGPVAVRAAAGTGIAALATVLALAL